MQDTTIISLLQKYIKNECTEQELRSLLGWLKSADDHASLDIITKPLWDTIDKKTPLPDNQRADELRSEVSSLLNEIRKKSGRMANPVRIDEKKRLNGFYRIAAILILALSVTFAILKVVDRPSDVITYIEQVSRKGEVKTILLADGTKVVLNSDTQLRIPDNFNKQERIIEIVGEGFFDVAHNPEKPFIIKSGEAQVKVLGTSFDFKSYAEDAFIKLTVSTGKVRVNVDKQDLQLSLSSNEHLSINKADGNIRKEVILENNYIKWMKGSLYFEKEPIQEVIKTINRTYNRKVILQCTDCKYVITGTHDNKSIEAVIEAICFTTGLRSRREGDRIIIYDKL